MWAEVPLHHLLSLDVHAEGVGDTLFEDVKGGGSIEPNGLGEAQPFGQHRTIESENEVGDELHLDPVPQRPDIFVSLRNRVEECLRLVEALALAGNNDEHVAPSGLGTRARDRSLEIGNGVFDNRDFIRGNVSVDRADHILSLQDVVDLAAFLFANDNFTFNCDAASDTNNDGIRNITDLVTSVHGIFSTVLMAPPNFLNPGIGIPGVVVPDGGTIPSILGCADGETCPYP